MRLVTFQIGSERRIGALDPEDAVVDLTLAREAQRSDEGHPDAAAGATEEIPSDMLQFLQLGVPALSAAEEALAHVREEGVSESSGRQVRHERGSVRLLSPLPRPNSLRDYMVVEEHVKNALKHVPEEWFNMPVYYKGNVDEVYGPDDIVPWPAYTDKLDYELEICAVIGRPGRRISAEDAAQHIVGYTIFNDWSARDIQLREMSVGIGPGLGKDFASSFGPCIATPDEFDRDNARLEARIDGEVWSAGVLGKMHFSFEEIMEWTSQEQTLHPGDLLGSGTVGRGCGFELDRWLTEGCEVELSAEGIGVLRNRVGFKGQGTTLPAETIEQGGSDG